jgi:Ca2+-transporting ATPase
MMIAIVLSLNMRKLLSENVLVRRLLGIETAGSVDLLLVDKTGTLTKGVFTPENFVSGDGKVFKGFKAIPDALQELLAFAIRESTSTLVTADKKIIAGNASDRALVAFMEDVGKIEDSDARVHVREHEVIFNSARKFSGVQLTLHPARKLTTLQGKQVTVIKGAPDFLLDHCKRCYTNSGDLAPLDRDRVVEAINSISRHGTRVIAVCTSSGKLTDTLPQPSPLDLIGILGIRDPIREDSKESLESAREAGIQVCSFAFRLFCFLLIVYLFIWCCVC